MEVNQVKEEAIGKWPGILSSLGIEVGDGKHCACPMCGGKDRFRFDDKDGAGTYICNQCGAGDGFSLIMKVLNASFIEACKEVGEIVGTVERTAILPEPKTSPDILRKLFKSSKPIKAGDPVAAYLKNRGLKAGPAMLRYCPKCWESETKMDQNAMLAVFSLPDGEAVTIQRIYIKDGKKLDIESPKKTMTPLKPMTGGSVRLYEYFKGTLGVAEGIETAIAVHEMYMIPVWATLSATLMESFVPPKGVEKVEIFADNDDNYTGQKAAFTLANRLWVKDGVKAYVETSKCGDFLEDLIETGEI